MHHMSLHFKCPVQRTSTDANAFMYMIHKGCWTTKQASDIVLTKKSFWLTFMFGERIAHIFSLAVLRTDAT